MSKYGFTNDRTEGRLSEAPLGRYITEIVSFQVHKIKHSKTRRPGEPFFKVRYRIHTAWPDSTQVKVMQGEVYEQTVFPNLSTPGLSNKDLINYCNAVYSAHSGRTSPIDNKLVVMAPEHKTADTLVCVEEYIDAGKVPPPGMLLQLKREVAVSKEGKLFPVHLWSPLTEQTLAYLQRLKAQAQAAGQTGQQRPAGAAVAHGAGATADI